jgi:streptogramin lyase
MCGARERQSGVGTMNRTKLEVITCVVALFASAPGLASGESVARSRALRLPDRSISVAAPAIIPTSSDRAVRVERVTLKNDGRRSLRLAESDFALSAQADITAPQGWDLRAARVAIAPKHSRAFRLIFALPRSEAQQAILFYRPTDGTRRGVVALAGSATRARRSSSPRSLTAPSINTFSVSPGVGDPWGTATDSAGDVWFAEPGCDFQPTCGPGTPPGQIGEIKASSHAIVLYTLPNIPGNQPIFPTFDGSGNLWFTTPNNSMIGEFSPSTGQFAGQWPVTAGTGPWDLTVAGGKIWYTEHLASAVGSFDPASHSHQDFATPSANSNPYGIAANGGLIWFTENNSSVDRIASLDTAHKNAISEYPLVLPTSNSTPHMIAIDRSGHPWWTEGWTNTIATLDPAVATAGQCGTTSGTCTGVKRFQLPPSTSCPAGVHTSGIAIQGSTNSVWLDNALTSQVGSFDPTTSTFAMSTVSSDCNAHPHDGLTLDGLGKVWFTEEFVNAIGEMDAGGPSPPPPPPTTTTTTTTTTPPPVSEPAIPPAQAGKVTARQATKVMARFPRQRALVVRRRVWVRGHWRIVKVFDTSVERIQYGARTTLSGWLGTPDGAALGNQVVWILSAPDDGSNRFTHAATALTAANGTWTATLPPGPSRLIEAVYGGSSTTEASLSPDVRVIVPSKIQLSISPARVPWGGEVLIRGLLLGGYVPADKAVVSRLLRLRIGTAGSYGTVEIPNVDRWGRFHASYCFNLGQGVVGSWLSVSTRSAAGYPYAPASSRRVAVTVGPGNAGRRCSRSR